MSKAKKITTPSMRRVPADEARMIEGGSPSHEKIKAAGWNRLLEILEEAMQDKTIAASCGTADLLELFHSIVADPSTLTAENNLAPLQPFINSMSASLKKKNDELLHKLSKAKMKS